MAKVTDAVTPTGQKVNLMNPMTWLQYALGFIFFFAVWSFSQKIGKKVESVTGGNVDITPAPVFDQPVQTVKVTQPRII